VFEGGNYLFEKRECAVERYVDISEQAATGPAFTGVSLT
jgi:hypothetical protein